MAAQESLLGPISPSRPKLGPTKNIIIYSTFLFAIYLLIKEDPVCDQPLVAWMLLLFAEIVGEILGEVLKCFSETAQQAYILKRCFLPMGFGGLWVWGHWPVYASEVCDATLWSFVFWFELLVDIGLGVIALGCCHCLATF